VHVETAGSGPRIVLLHGSGGNSGWPSQRALIDRYTLVMPTRTGYPPNPPLERIDFEDQAAELLEILEPGDHLVAHSYGGVVSLLAAASADLRSLAVLEPPAFGVARSHPAVDDLIAELSPLWPTDLPTTSSKTSSAGASAPNRLSNRLLQSLKGLSGPYFEVSRG
jgi:pimeloyl-ACP methyl ester carboxylesterase